MRKLLLLVVVVLVGLWLAGYGPVVGVVDRVISNAPPLPRTSADVAALGASASAGGLSYWETFTQWLSQNSWLVQAIAWTVLGVIALVIIGVVLGFVFRMFRALVTNLRDTFD